MKRNIIVSVVTFTLLPREFRLAFPSIRGTETLPIHVIIISLYLCYHSTYVIVVLSNSYTLYVMCLSHACVSTPSKVPRPRVIVIVSHSWPMSLDVLGYQSYQLQRYHSACGHKGPSHLFPVLALRSPIAMQVQHPYNSSTNG